MVKLFDVEEADGLMKSVMEIRDRLNSTREAFYDSSDEVRGRLKDIEDTVLNLTDLMMVNSAAILTIGEALTGSGQSSNGQA